MKIPAYLQQNRYGIYHFRRAIPYDLRPIVGKREFIKSLQTRDPKKAVQLARIITTKTDELFASLISNMNKKNKRTTVRTEYGGMSLLPDGTFEFEGTTPADIEAMTKAGMSPEQIKEVMIANNASNQFVSEQFRNTSTTHTQDNDIRLSDLIIKYNEDRIAIRGGKWTPPKGDVTKFRRLVEILGDVTINSVTRDPARKVRNKISSLPQNTNPHRNKTVNQILFDIKPDEELMSSTNINHHLTLYTSLFKWAKREGLYTSENPFEGLTIIDKTPDNEKRTPFTKDDLSLIFNGTRFTNYNEKTHQPHHYWAPLIALYTGARPAEIGALEVSDIQKITSNEQDQYMYVFNINTHDNTTRLKTDNAVRHIPVHPKLLELGLLEYCETVKEKGKERLFHYLKWEDKTGYGRYIGEHFNKYLKELEIHENRTKVFYSFRHTLATSLERAGVSHDRIEQISGRSSPIKKTTGQQYYISNPEAHHLLDELMKVDYSEQLKSVKPYFDVL